MRRGHIAGSLLASLALALFFARQLTVFAASGQTTAQTTVTGAEQNPEALGSESYAQHCAICHGEQREGLLPAFPPLLGIKRQMKDPQLTELIHHGKGRMPGFPKLQHEELTALLHFLGTDNLTPLIGGATQSANLASIHASPLSGEGKAIFQQNCAFCHGRDAGGGETGPDLTRSKLVSEDVGGNKIMDVIRNGRPAKKMPAFSFSQQELLSLVAFVHAQEAAALAMKGGRRGVDVSDLQTGDVAAGKRYFNGAGTCSKCHSPTGDLAGVAKRYRGLELEERMLYPRDVKARVTITLPSGEATTGTLVYQDEFTVGLRDAEGRYRSWPVSRVRVVVDAPAETHADLFPNYTDDDIHNLMAYIQTLR